MERHKNKRNFLRTTPEATNNSLVAVKVVEFPPIIGLDAVTRPLRFYHLSIKVLCVASIGLDRRLMPACQAVLQCQLQLAGPRCFRRL